MKGCDVDVPGTITAAFMLGGVFVVALERVVELIARWYRGGERRRRGERRRPRL